MAESDLPLNFTTRLNKELKRLIKSLYDGDKIVIDSRTTSLVGQAVSDAMEVGYGSTIGEVDFTTPDGAMLSRLTRDVWQFSAAKNYQQMRDMTLALHDDNGKLRPFNEFEEAARSINAKYNATWLKTEYNQAVGSATMAARWTDFKQNEDIMSYLMYQTVGDENVRQEHRPLDGIIRKISDHFWSTHYPPNDWGCRCDVVQVAESTAHETEKERIPTVPIPSMFRTNLAETGLIFPKGHPYYEGIPAGVLQKAVASLPDNVAYNTVYTSETTGNTVDMHIMHGAAEAGKNIEAAKVLADNGHDVKLLPILGLDDNNIREIVYKTKDFIAGKNPDALVDGAVWEFKVMEADTTTNMNIQRNIGKGRVQANNVLIMTKQTATDATIKNAVKGMKPTAKSKVWVINNKQLTKH